MANTSTTTIGLDLCDKFSRLCVLDEAGDVVEEDRVRTSKTGMTRAFGKRAGARVVLEVGPHSRWVSERISELGHEVIVANPRQLALIYGSRKKNDRVDAERLARLGRVDPELLAPIQHRGDVAQRTLTRIRARDQLVTLRTALINHVRGVVKSYGERLPTSSSAGFAKCALNELPHELRSGLLPLLRTLEELTPRIREYDRVLEHIAEHEHPETAVLRQVQGVGPLTALTFIATLEDPNRFPKSRQVGAYLGLTPRQSQTGEDDPQLGITKCGDPMLRRLLVNCAHHVMGRFGGESDLRAWGLRLAERGGKNAKKRAVVAVARKLSVLLHRLWLTGEEYQPVGYHRLPTAA